MSSQNFTYLEGYIQRAEEREVGRNGNRVLSFTLAYRNPGDDAGYSYFDCDHWNTPEAICNAIIDAGEQEQGDGPSRKFGVRGSLFQERWENDDCETRSRIKVKVTTIFLPQYSENNDDDDDKRGGGRKKKKKNKKKSSKRSSSRGSGRKKSSRKGGNKRKRRRDEEDEEEYDDPEDGDGDEDDEGVPF